MNRIIQISTHPFWHSVRIAFSGMLVAQLIPFLGSLIIVRLNLPEEFGLFATWLGLVSFTAVIVTGRLEVALSIEPNGEPRRFATIAVLIIISTSCLLLSSVMLCVYIGTAFLNTYSTMLLLLFAPAVLFVAAIQTWQYWVAAEGQYYLLSWIRISQALGISGMQIIISYFVPTAIGMSCGFVLGTLIGLCVAAYSMPLKLSSLKPLSKFWIDLSAFLVRQHRFPFLSLPADAINSFSAQIPLLLISSKYTLEYSGLYALTIRMLGGPISLLGTAILDVFKRSAANSYRDYGNCKNDYIRTLYGLSLGSLMILLTKT